MENGTMFAADTFATTILGLNMTLLQLRFLNPIDTLEDPGLSLEYVQMGLTASCLNFSDASMIMCTLLKCEVHSVGPDTCMVSNRARVMDLVNFTLPLIVSK